MNTYQHRLITALTSERQTTFPETFSSYKKSVWFIDRKSDLQTCSIDNLYLTMSLTGT